MLTVKSTSVFYDQEGYPFKDAQRTVRYPITGGTFAGSHNTKQIRFYVRDIGGTTNITWVVLSKLPNGKLGYEICSNVAYDEELGEYYLLFDLSAYYTSVKGDLYLSLRGYQGEVAFEDDDSDGVYNIVGDPLIEVTGTIKLSINYSPMVNTGTQVLPSDIDRILAALSNYLKLENAVIFTHDITTLNASDYDAGQVVLEYKNNLANFYYVAEVSQTKVFFFAIFETLRSNEVRTLTISAVQTINLLLGGKIEKSGNDILITNNSHTLKLDVNGVLTLDNENIATEDYVDNAFDELDAKKVNIFTSNFAATETIENLFNSIGRNWCIVSLAGKWYLARLTDIATNLYSLHLIDLSNLDHIYKNSITGQTTISSFLSTATNAENATKSYVNSQLQEFLQKEYDKVDITEYPTLNDFLASTGEEGYIYLYPIDTSDDTKGYYQYIWENNAWISLGTTQIDLSGYVEKTSSANKVYGTNELGAQTTYTVDDFYEGNIARRDTDGSITVPLTPTQNGHASSKKYVDDEINDLSSEVDEKLEEKANVDGNYPTLTVGLADNLTPYSEDSGAEQDKPFISNGTGTNNNTEIVTVGDYGLFKEKQGHTLVANQLCTKSFISGGQGGLNYSWDNGKLTVTGTCDGTGNSYRLTNPLQIGHKYLILSSNWDDASSSTWEIRETNGTNTKVRTNSVVAPTSGASYLIFAIYFYSGYTANLTLEVNIIDITSWEQSVIDDLTANPSHFSWYYNGSLAYNAGSLENASGVKLVSTGRNIYNPSETYNIVIPNKPFFASKTTTITYYDKDKNSIGTESVSAGNTFTTPSNCVFISSSVSAITITPYYTDQEGGEGYKDNNSNTPIEYQYETPYVVDTGNEVLRQAGNVKDYKEPNGTIHRVVGSYTFTGNESWSAFGSNGGYQTNALPSGAKAVGISGSVVPNMISETNLPTTNRDTIYSGGSGISCNDVNVYVSDTSNLTGKTIYYELATETTEQGTPFPENLPINDYGMLYWLDENDELVGIPQGAKIFYPTNYKGFIDDLYSKVDGNSDDYALNSELNAKFETYLKSLSGYDAGATQQLKNINGTLTWVTEGE